MKYELPNFQVAMHLDDTGYARTFIWPKLALEVLEQNNWDIHLAAKVLTDKGIPENEAFLAVEHQWDLHPRGQE